MSATATARDFSLSNRSIWLWPTFLALFLALQASFYPASIALAEITFSDDVIPGDPAAWNSTTDGYIGKTATGSVIVNGRSVLVSRNGFLGYDPNVQGTVTVDGTGSIWSGSGYDYYVGYSGTGFLNITNGGAVNLSGGPNVIARIGGSNSLGTSTVTVEGSTSAWNNDCQLWVGSSGKGTLNIRNGGSVSNIWEGALGFYQGSQGTVNVSGIGSKWTTADGIDVGLLGSGTLNIGAGPDLGGLVKTKSLQLGRYSGSSGTCNLGNGATLQTETLEKGSGTATFNWNDGTIRNYNANTDLNVTSSLTLMLAATGTHEIHIDQWRHGRVGATLSDVTIGGTLTKTGAGSLDLYGISNYTGATVLEEGILAFKSPSAMASGPHIIHGGTLGINNFTKSIAAFSITGGTVIGTGMLMSNEPYDVQAGTINPRLGGTVDLNKTGAGVATLTNLNMYSGATAVREGKLSVTGAILSTSGISVAQAGILELAKTSGSAMGVGVEIENEGTVLVLAGAQTVGTITGTGTTQVTGSASLTAASISQSTLTVDAGAADATAIGQVPEPAVIVLLVIGILSLIAVGRVAQSK